MTETDDRVVVVGVQSAIGIATLRSLANRGIACIAVSHAERAAGLHSRHACAAYVVPYREAASEEYVDRIVEIAGRHGASGILCHHERQMQVLGEATGQGERGLRMLFPPPPVVRRVVDKAAVLEVAAALGLDTPRSAIVGTRAEAAAEAAQMRFPLILKPAGMPAPGLGETWSFKCRFLESPAALERQVKNFPDGRGAFLLQEFVVGRYVGMGLAVQAGQAVAAFQWSALREYEAGLGALRRSEAPDPLLREQSERLCRELGYEGVCEVEFRGDPATGRYTLMEVNPRLWGGMTLPVYCGVDFPWLGYRIHLRRPVDPVDSYRVGVYSRNFLGDVKWFLKAFVLGAYERESPNLRYGRFAALRDFIASAGCASVHDLESWDDPMPAVRHYLSKLGVPA